MTDYGMSTDEGNQRVASLLERLRSMNKNTASTLAKERREVARDHPEYDGYWPQAAISEEIREAILQFIVETAEALL